VNLTSAVLAANDPAVTITPNAITSSTDVFNYYLSENAVSSGAINNAQLPGATQLGLTDPETILQYWNAMSPWLKSNMGLSGLRRGMGCPGHNAFNPYARAYVDPGQVGGYVLRG
jgi:hypothetical protein